MSNIGYFKERQIERKKKERERKKEIVLGEEKDVKKRKRWGEREKDVEKRQRLGEEKRKERDAQRERCANHFECAPFLHPTRYEFQKYLY